MMSAAENDESTSKNVPWFKLDIADIQPAFREILEIYSRIPSEAVKPHIVAIREKGWQTFPYPCIGQFNFLTLSISIHRCYPRVLSSLSDLGSETTLLDLGCCFGQDIRKLVHDGAASERLYGCDLEHGFIDLGYELFADRNTLKTHFFTADILSSNSPLTKMEGKFDFIHIGSFLHLFTLSSQTLACTRMAKLLKPQPGSTVFGRQMGNVEALSVEIQGKTLWQHDPRSFEEMWKKVGDETGTQWKVVAELDEGEGMDETHWSSKGCRRLKFEVTRLA